jgi:hypothetical protein
VSDEIKTTTVPRDLAWRVACAMHNADEPPCDWVRLPHEDTIWGIGKDRRLMLATVAIQAIANFLLERSVHDL